MFGKIYELTIAPVQLLMFHAHSWLIVQTTAQLWMCYFFPIFFSICHMEPLNRASMKKIEYMKKKSKWKIFFSSLSSDWLIRTWHKCIHPIFNWLLPLLCEQKMAAKKMLLFFFASRSTLLNDFAVSSRQDLVVKNIVFKMNCQLILKISASYLDLHCIIA